MKCALFLALLLLLRLLPSAETRSSVPAPTKDPLLMLDQTNGSTCAQWLCGMSPPRMKAFGCPKQPGGAKVKFCCGICNQMRNCSFEEADKDFPARPTDGGPQPCLPSIPVTQWERVALFCGGIVATIIFYWVAYRPCRRYWRKKRSARETPQEGIQLEVSSSERSRESAEASNTLVPPSSAGAGGPQNPHGCPNAASGSAPGAQPQGVGSENVTIMWYPTGFVPLRIGPNSSSQATQRGKRPLAKSEK